MNELIEKVSNDPALMLGSVIGVVLILFVVLVVVVAAMRIKTYKDRFVNVRIDNIEKEKRIEELQHKLQTAHIKVAQNEQELQQFSDTRTRLSKTEESLHGTQKRLSEVQSLQGKTQAQLESTQGLLESLKKEHEDLKERFDNLGEENNKLRINNARLLMKLESEERLATQLQKRQESREG